MNSERARRNLAASQQGLGGSPTHSLEPEDLRCAPAEDQDLLELPDAEELPDREALRAFLESSDEDEDNDMPDPKASPVPDLVASESEGSSTADPDDVPFLFSNAR